MREIRFKFLMEDGQVTNPYYLRELIDSDSYVNIECEYSSKIKQELQYTGLKDKNGVEIYESDIIKAIWSKDCDEYIANEEWIGDIFFNYGSFDINGEWCVALNCFNGTLEVIGNIYENKELLA